MIQFFAYFFLWSFLLSVVAQVWALKLTQEGNILFFVRKYLYALLERYAQKEPQNFSVRYNRGEYFLKPLVDCEHCISGQLAFWFYLFYFSNHFIYLIPFICLTIYITEATKKVWN